jgi:hypothetical protein
MARGLLLTAVMLAQVAAAGVCGAADQPRAQLPRLAQPITIDGDLGDWAGIGAVSIPIWSESDICYRASGYQWRGPADISMEVYCGWRPEGLYFAATVADDKVENLRTDGAIYWEDSIGFYLDGRIGPEFGKSAYSAGAWQATVAPPLSGPDVVFGTSGPEGQEEQLTVKGKATPTGYIIEALIPWRTLPEFTPKPGAVMALNFAVNDYDGSDPEADRVVQLNAGAAKDLYLYADRLTRW